MKVKIGDIAVISMHKNNWRSVFTRASFYRDTTVDDLSLRWEKLIVKSSAIDSALIKELFK